MGGCLSSTPAQRLSLHTHIPATRPEYPVLLPSIPSADFLARANSANFLVSRVCRGVSAVVRCSDNMLTNGHARILQAIHPTDRSMGHTQVGGRENRFRYCKF